MKVEIAGYNIDSSLINQLDSNAATPETISAAYARISRSSKSVTELRRESLKQVEKARTSNESIIFGMGHSSVAEHAVFNIDLIGISRYLTEMVQAGRLASFTEKSQRYVTFNKDYIIPEEFSTLPDSGILSLYQELMDHLFHEYEVSFQDLIHYYEKTEPSLPRRELEGKAKEDARYILPLSTKTQMGMTLNARSLESLLRRLYHTELLEARELYDKLISPISRISPSLVKYTTESSLKGLFDLGFLGDAQNPVDSAGTVCKVIKGSLPETEILAALLFEFTGLDHSTCTNQLCAQDEATIATIWEQLFSGIRPWHKLPRAFETINVSLELWMSESCWAQFKRHRIGTTIKKSKADFFGMIIPEAIAEIGHESAWHDLNAQTRDLAQIIDGYNASLSPYLRLNSTRISVYCQMNLREIYHFVRLRSDHHAQWEIRSLSDQLVQQLRELYPNACRYLMGKSDMK